MVRQNGQGSLRAADESLEKVGAFGLTEPAHGTDVVKLETTAHRDGDSYVPNGHKRWIGNATLADYVIIWARGDEDGHVGGYVIGHPEAAEDPRFHDTPSRRAHAADIVTLLDKRFATRPLAEWREVLDTAGLTYGVVQTLEEYAHDPQLLANRIVVPIEDGSSETHLTVNSPVHLDQEQKVPARPAPDLGEHTEEVLTELGFSADDIESLRSGGAIPR
ncbi:CoA transferase [Streptomyces sp. NPDC053086]|uniref:CoA transferase n=1 Tax=unclassified Streptomyces TaxID=2593676 RepID=UPI0037CEDBA0